jgi:Trk K+ transport system NAD-binding subunit
LRTIVFSGLTHAGYLTVRAMREIDPNGKLIVVEATAEKLEVAKKQFPWAEVLRQGIDESIKYLTENSEVIDVVIACSDSDAVNYRFCKAAIEVGIPLVIPVLNNPLNKPLFQRGGIKTVIDPFSTIELRLHEILKPSGIIPLYESLNGKIVLFAYRSLVTFKPKTLKKGAAAILASKINGSATRRPRSVGKGETLYVLGEKETVKKYLESAQG